MTEQSMSSKNMFLVILVLNLPNIVHLLEIQVDSKDKREVCAERMNCISSNIALKAAAEAKAAENAQFGAANRAAFKIKEQLAEKAFEAAKAAQAAAAVKSALVEEIMRETEAVKVVILELMRSKRRIEQAIEGQLRALQSDKSAFNILVTALHVAQGTCANADSALGGIHNDLLEKERILQSALYRTNVLATEEQCARQDLATTKCAARNALIAANAARANAMRVKRSEVAHNT
ncbi:uncharacterized protein LOC123685492 [Harmonia axyridis]|uniref:uncharacterized protein LOC123685492 n=1 Tax=Harmonia axyridis TaxID=115357 RepID=UPI001E279CD9|nr:uncharacterized protein LOC123685492 [Harmonia axyridis]